jgi:hypothetical protein
MAKKPKLEDAPTPTPDPAPDQTPDVDAEAIRKLHRRIESEAGGVPKA